MSDGDYSVKSYGIFDSAVSTTKKLSDLIKTGKEEIEEEKTKLLNESVFMGPISDSCKDAFSTLATKIDSLTADYSTIQSYLTDASATYKTGDEKAKQKIISFSDGKLVVGTSQTSGVQTGKTNQDTIYNYLAKQGFNDAAICGILANIQHESGFSPTALGDGGTSYGICQWHLGRWDRLKSYCSENNLDVDSVDGQVSYLVWELQNNYPSVYNKLKSVPNTSQGAYDAAYEWTVNFEIPANKENAGQNRGNTAVSSYWPTYSNTETV